MTGSTRAAGIPRSTFHRVAILLILLVGSGLRWHALTRDVRFHPDESLFATFARNAAVYGDWMLPGALDKPPLSLYADALSMQFVGVSVNSRGVLDLGWRQGEFAARLPGTLAGILLIALVYALGCRLSSPAGGLFAAALAAGSPWLIAFSATAFTDPLMLTALAAALAAALPAPLAARGRPGWSGFWLAAAFWSKQQAVFYLPLVLWVMFDTWKRNFTPEAPRKTTLTAGIIALLRPVMTFTAGVLLLLAWDAARGETSIFALAAVNNNPERTFVTAAELLPRLQLWLDYMAGGFGGAGWTLMLMSAAAGAVLIPSRWRGLRRVLLIYGLAYFAVHVVFAFNMYDRYLLPLIPLITALAGAGLTDLIERTARRWRRANRVHFQGIALAILLAVPVLSGSASAPLPFDSRAWDHELITLAAYLNAKPLGAILYNHWLGWELTYYLGAWSDKRQVYYPEPVIQAQDALRNPDPAPRYWIVPQQVDPVPWLDAFQAANFAIRLDYFSGSYRVYRLVPPFGSSSS